MSVESDQEEVHGDLAMDGKESATGQGLDEGEQEPGPSSNGKPGEEALQSKPGENADQSDVDSDLDSDESDSHSEDEDSDEDSEDDGREKHADENRLLPEVKLPKSITCDESVVSLQFHPKGNMLAAGLIDGSVALYSYLTEDPNEELLLAEVHQKACRAVVFTEDGRSLLSVSKDKSLSKLDIASGQVEQNVEKAHEFPIYSMAVVNENFVATGDDDGHVKVWDMRTEKAIMEMRENEEFISSLVVGKDNKTLLATSGDGTLSTFNVRRRRFDLQSEHVNSELLSATLMKRGQKVVCGDSNGALNIFSWGEFGDISDRFPGHSSPIDCCVAITENVLCTGCIDGTIRAVHILPNRFLGIVGDHGELPVESMSVSFDSAFLASCALEDKIRFWGVGHVQQATVDPRGKAARSDASKRLTETGDQENFFSDL